MSTCASLLAAMPFGLRAQTHPPIADPAEVKAIIDDFIGEAEVIEGGVTLNMDAQIDDGYRVPVSIDAPNAQEVMLIAPMNPEAMVLRVRFQPMIASRSVSSRIRLAMTQDVSVYARQSDGTIAKVTRTVDVLSGGCS